MNTVYGVNYITNGAICKGFSRKGAFIRNIMAFFSGKIILLFSGKVFTKHFRYGIIPVSVKD